MNDTNDAACLQTMMLMRNVDNMGCSGSVVIIINGMVALPVPLK